MGTLGKLASKAIDFLRRVGDIFSGRDPQYSDAIKLLKEAAADDEKLAKFFRLLEEAEMTVGAHTEAWRRIDEASKSGDNIVLSEDEVAYLARFKDIFDRTIRRL